MSVAYPVYGNEHRLLKRRILALSFIDLIFITSTVIFVVIQLITVGNVFQMEEPDGKNETLSSLNITSLETAELAMSLTLQREESDTSNLEGSSTACNESDVNCESKDSHSEEDADDFLYRTVVGARISLSIQLIIYISQLGFGILVFIAAYHNDSKNLHFWVIFSEIILVVICLNMFVNFFGRFLWVSVIVTSLYIIFKIILIRLVRRFINVNDLALTQFGSVNEFD